MQKVMWIIVSCLMLSQLQAQQAFTYPAWDGSTVDINQKMRDLNIPGVSFVVVKNGKILTSQQWGISDRKSQQVVKANTLFQAGSMSNGIAAILTLQAVEEGKLDLNTDINHYLKSWKLPNNRFTKNDPVTIKDLLTKRRGFTQNQKPNGYTKGSPVPSLQQILNGEGPSNTKGLKLRSGTHEQDNYSFETEVILQQILEDVFEKPYRELAQERILNPLDMHHSTFNLELDEEQRTRAASGYQENDQAVVGGWLIFPEAASAGLWTTAEDFAKLSISLMKAYNGADNELLSPATARRAFLKVNNDKALIYNNWGPGTIYGYGGAPEGYYATFESDPAHNWSVIILSNKHIQWRFVNELRDGLKAKYNLLATGSSSN